MDLFSIIILIAFIAAAGFLFLYFIAMPAIFLVFTPICIVKYVKRKKMAHLVWAIILTVLMIIYCYLIFLASTGRFAVFHM